MTPPHGCGSGVWYGRKLAFGFAANMNDNILYHARAHRQTPDNADAEREIVRANPPAPPGRGKNRSLDEHISPEQVRHIRSSHSRLSDEHTHVNGKATSTASWYGINPKPQVNT